jgi:hypothetical protein
MVSSYQVNKSMTVKLDLAGLKQTKWHEFAIRFIFGGLITVLTGIIAKKFGPGVGGLFLAFPAIFPASVTLVESHEKEKKFRSGLSGTSRGRDAAALDARGASMGSLGLFAFAVIVWKWIPAHQPWFVLGSASFAWLFVSTVTWTLRSHFRRLRRHFRG